MSKSLKRVKAALVDAGMETAVLEMPDHTRTARQAADAAGCALDQIAKSIIFQGQDTGVPYRRRKPGRCRQGLGPRRRGACPRGCSRRPGADRLCHRRCISRGSPVADLRLLGSPTVRIRGHLCCRWHPKAYLPHIARGLVAIERRRGRRFCRLASVGGETIRPQTISQSLMLAFLICKPLDLQVDDASPMNCK